MRNVNVNALFADILLNPDNERISLIDIGKPIRILADGDVRKISRLSMAVVVSAIQSKKHNTTLDPDEVFVFSETYEIIVRLTETISGSFKDLGGFEVTPAQNDVHEGICRHTFHYTHLGIYQDISLPDISPNEVFVIKLLIRRKKENGQENDWIVQSVVPLAFGDNAEEA